MGVLGQRVDIVEVSQTAVENVSGGVQMSFGRAPADEQGVALLIALNDELGYMVAHLLNLMLAGKDHLLVVLGVGGDRTFLCVALQTYVTVFEPFHAGCSPVAYHRLGVAQSGVVLTLELLWNACHMYRLQLAHLGYAPQTRSVGKIGVGEKDDGSHVL